MNSSLMFTMIPSMNHLDEWICGCVAEKKNGSGSSIPKPYLLQLIPMPPQLQGHSGYCEPGAKQLFWKLQLSEVSSSPPANVTNRFLLRSEALWVALWVKPPGTYMCGDMELLNKGCLYERF